MEINEINFILYSGKRGFIVENYSIVPVAEQISHAVLFLHIVVTYDFASVDFMFFRFIVELFRVEVDVLV